MDIGEITGSSPVLTSSWSCLLEDPSSIFLGHIFLIDIWFDSCQLALLILFFAKFEIFVSKIFILGPVNIFA